MATPNGLLASGRALRCRAVRKGVGSAKPSGGSKTKTRGKCLGLCFGSPCWARTERRKKTDTLITQYARKLANLASSPCARGAGAVCEQTWATLPSAAPMGLLNGKYRVLLFERNKGKKTKSRPPIGDLLFVGSPCWARTSDTLINSQVLVPTELRRNMKGIHKLVCIPFMSAMTYFPGPSPDKYFRHCKA